MMMNYCRSPWVVAFKLRTHYPCPRAVDTARGFVVKRLCPRVVRPVDTGNVYRALDRCFHSIFLLRLLPLHFAVSGIAKTAQCYAYQYAL